jgi:hypothetical protein
VAGDLIAQLDASLEPSAGAGTSDVRIAITGQFCWDGATVDGSSFTGVSGAVANVEGTDIFCNAATCSDTCL